MSYSELNRWARNEEARGYLPEGSASIIANSGASDRELYAYATKLHKSWRGKPLQYGKETDDAESETFYLVPHVEKDGSVYYVDRKRNKVVMSMIKQPNGLFSYQGDRKMMVVLGGRGELGQMLEKVKDGDFFHDQR